MFDWLNNLIAKIETLGVAAVAVIALLMILRVLWRSQSASAVIGVVLLGAFALWAVNGGLEMFSDLMGQDAVNLGQGG